jgi:hypothetical protein
MYVDLAEQHKEGGTYAERGDIQEKIVVGSLKVFHGRSEATLCAEGGDGIVKDLLSLLLISLRPLSGDIGIGFLGDTGQQGTSTKLL